MTWTPADEREYQSLLRQRRLIEARQHGDAALEQANVSRSAAPATKEGFSFWRAGVGAVRDAAQGAMDFVDDTGDYLGRKTGIGGIAFGAQAKNGVVEYQGYDEFNQRGGDVFFGAKRTGVAKVVADGSGVTARTNYQLPQPCGSENAGTAEHIVRGVGSFVVPFAGAMRAMRGIEAVTVVGKAAKAVTAGTVANLANVDPAANNLAGILRDTFNIDSETLDFLAAHNDEDGITTRVKAAVTNLPLDIGLEAAMAAGGAAFRMYRDLRSVSAESRALVEAAQSDLTIKRTLAEARADLGDSPVRLPGGERPADQVGAVAMPKGANDVDAPAKAGAGPKAAEPVVQAVPPPASADAPPMPPSTTEGAPMADAVRMVPAPKRIETLDDFMDYAKGVVGNVTDPAELDRLATALVENPHNALDQLGIDPLKLNYELLDDPTKLIAIQDSLGTLLDGITQKTGRTGIHVTNAETIKSARALAMSPRVLMGVMQNTAGLAGKLTGARIIVGQHAHKLLGSVDDAIAEMAAGSAGKAYNQFLEDLHRHAHLLGVLRGAGSEVGRALQSLQMRMEVTKAGKVVTAQASDALAKARALAARDAAREASVAAKQVEKQAVKDAKDAARAAKEVDQSAPQVIEFLEKLSEHELDSAALADIATKHGIEPRAVAKQLGLDWKQLDTMEKAQKAYTDLFQDVATDAGKLRLLNQLKEVKGDLPALSRIVKVRNGNALNKADAAVRDTIGNLFSTGTAYFNVLSGATQLGLKSMTHLLASTGHMAMSRLGLGGDNALAARVHLLKSWANVHAPMVAFTDAMTNTWKLLQKEGLNELAALSDTAGFEAFAKRAQAASIKAGNGLVRGVVRDETRQGFGWYVSPERLRSVLADADDWPVGRFGQEGLKWFGRAVATAINVPGSASRLMTSAFINAPDQFMGSLAFRAGAHTAAIDKAVEEAMEAELKGPALLDYVKARSMDLAEHLDGTTAEPFDAGVEAVLENEGRDFAKSVLFQDDVEWRGAHALAALGEVPIVGTMLLPFIRTPLRILERSVVDFTPLGLLKNTVREAWASGDTALRGEIAARYTLATSMMLMGIYLTTTHDIVGYNGGIRNSARLTRPSYSIRIGGDVWEFNRADPLGTVLGLSADFVESLRHTSDSDDGLPERVFEAGMWAVFKSILSKSWLQSMSPLIETMAAPNEATFGTKMDRLFAGMGQRFVPGSGVQRQFDKAINGEVREAQGLIEGWLKGSWGSATLPVKRDPLLGRPLDMLPGERMFGVRGGPEVDDVLERELADLYFDLPAASRKQRGVELTSSQYSRWLELKGQVVTDASGLTAEGKLKALVGLAEWATAGREQKLDAVRNAVRGYARLATEQLIQEDKKFAFDVLKARNRDLFLGRSRTVEEADAETLRFAKELGIVVGDPAGN